MNTKENAVATIPFQGFYESLYSYAIDNEIELATEWHAHEYNLTDAQQETLANGYLDVRTLNFYSNISKDYAESFIYEIEKDTGLSLNASFDGMSMPREYNFATDRIFIELPEESAVAFTDYILANHKEELEDLIKQNFTTRSGFISHYENSLEAWGNPSEWDLNQLGTCFEIFAYLEEEIFEIGDLFESISIGLDDTLSGEAVNMLAKCKEEREIKEANEKAQLKLALS